MLEGVGTVVSGCHNDSHESKLWMTPKKTFIVFAADNQSDSVKKDFRQKQQRHEINNCHLVFMDSKSTLSYSEQIIFDGNHFILL